MPRKIDALPVHNNTMLFGKDNMNRYKIAVYIWVYFISCISQKLLIFDHSDISVNQLYEYQYTYFTYVLTCTFISLLQVVIFY